jgi:hypothetical protein
MSSATQSVRQVISGRYITHSVLKEYLDNEFPDRYTIEVSWIAVIDYRVEPC